MLWSCLILKRLWCSGLKPGYQTLKAFANSSPGFALKPWVKRGHIYFVATLKELRRHCDSADGDATLSGLRLQKHSDAFFPRVAKAQPWAEISERFQR
jgi:hypothetical protein